MSKLGVKTVERIKATGKGFVSTCTGSSFGELDYLTGFWDGEIKPDTNYAQVQFVHGKCGVNRYALVEATQEEIDAIIKESEFANPVIVEFFKEKQK